MYKKIIFAAVLIAFVCVQLAYSLQCYECGSASECRKAGVVTCNEKNGNATSNRLSNYFQGVSNNTHTNFHCLHYNGSEANNVVEFKGCVYQHVDACNLRALPNHASLVKTNCTKCAGNLCNGRSPAGTFSSSLYPLMASAILVLIAKVSAF